MVKEQSFVASFAFSISTDVTAGLGGSQTFTKMSLKLCLSVNLFFLERWFCTEASTSVNFCTPFQQETKQL